MKMTEINSLDDGDLQVQLDKCHKELFGLRVRAATESIENPQLIGGLRRDIARLLTEKRRREMVTESQS